MTMTSAVTRPILPSGDLDRTDAFYGPLGFEVVGRWPDEYLILTGPDDIELHFWHKPDVSRWTNDVACWIGYPDVDALRRRHAAWAAVQIPEPATLNEPGDMSGHLVEFQLIDLFGNLLRLGTLKEQGSTLPR
jgi:catechol 2,3-dioxygenase-like lactoylglutathione lyase family enzyme